MAFGDFTVDRNSTKYVLGSGGTIVSYPTDEPAFEFNADGTYKGLLVEPAATNILLNSENPSNNSVIKGFRYSVNSYSTSTQYTASIWIKRTAGTGRTIQFNDDRDFLVNFDTSTLALNVWTRISVTDSTGLLLVNQLDIEQFTSTTPSYVSNYGVAPDGTTTSRQISDGTDTYEVWGAQVETGPIATSYIPTTSAAVTRVKDNITQTGAQSLIGQTEGTLYVEVDWKATGGTDRVLLEVNNGGVNNRIVIYDSGGEELRMFGTANGVVLTNQGESSSAYSGIQKFALAYKTNDFELYRNGSSISSDTSGSLAALATLTDIDLGQNYNAIQQAKMWIRAVAIYPKRLSDAEAIALTTL